MDAAAQALLDRVTRVRFYHNAADPLALTCELVGRACERGRQISIRLPDESALRSFDDLLWCHDSRSFVPHVTVGSALADETPVILGYANPVWPCTDMLFNLADDIPPDVASFRVLIEIVGQQESYRLPARRKWQHYKSAGFKLEAFDAVRREAL